MAIDTHKTAIVQRTTCGRSGLVGNPSDLFGGKVISLLFDTFAASVRLYESEKVTIVPNKTDVTTFKNVNALASYRQKYGYYGGIRLIEALIVRFHYCCQKRGICLPQQGFTLEYNSNIPFGLGLGGSSAIVTAVFNSLMDFYCLSENDIPKAEQPNIILEAETKELGISAGPQDRVVAVYGGLVAMDFSSTAYKKNGGLHGTYVNLESDLLPPLFIVYNEKLSKSSGTIHNLIRYKVAVENDGKIAEVMAQKAALVDEAITILREGHPDRLGLIMDRDFDLRRSIYNLSEEQTGMIDIARGQGAHAKFSGSGGAAIGTYEDKIHLERIRKAFNCKGFTVIPIQVAKADASTCPNDSTANLEGNKDQKGPSISHIKD